MDIEYTDGTTNQPMQNKYSSCWLSPLASTEVQWVRRWLLKPFKAHIVLKVC